jgi:uncharacterized protein (DUF433 family)
VDWRTFIHTDPRILRGKPVVRGTRLSVEFVLDLLAEGWTQQQFLESYPQLTPDALRAIFAFVADKVREEAWYPGPAGVR